MNKRRRIKEISGLIAKGGIADQESLKTALARKGVVVSQASLSRDLRELGAVRRSQPDGRFAYVLPDVPPAAKSPKFFAQRFATSVTGVRRAGFMVVVFTPPGEAQLVGRLLDEAGLPGLVGTVAGDDTIFCVAQHVKAAQTLETKFKELTQ